MNKDMNENHDKKVNRNTDGPSGQQFESDANNALSESDPRKEIIQAPESGKQGNQLPKTNQMRHNSQNANAYKKISSNLPIPLALEICIISKDT